MENGKWETRPTKFFQSMTNDERTKPEVLSKYSR